MITRRRFNSGMLSLAAVAGAAASGAAGTGTVVAAISESPLAAGFRVPDSSSLHLRTFMQWPVNLAIHADPAALSALQASVARLADTVARFEPVVMLAAGEHHGAIGEKVTNSNIELWDIPTDDLWCRDAAPVFTLDATGRLAAIDLNFNGWGNKQPHGNDALVAARIAERLGLHLFDTGLVGEAGGVVADGRGNLIAHESSWVNPNRNIRTREAIGDMLLATYGATNLVWAPGIIGADITDHHIGSLASFTPSGAVLVQLPDEMDESDPWSVAAYRTFDTLLEAGSSEGHKFEIGIIPEPVNVRSKREGFFASYVNYHVVNGAVIAPEYGDEVTDQAARELLELVYPGREIVMIDVDALGEAGGGIQRATAGQPASAGIWKPA